MNFQKTNLSGKKPSITIMTGLSTHDQRTSYGRNLRNISNDCGIPIDDLTNLKVKKLMTYRVVPNDQQWRVKLFIVFNKVNLTC